MPDDKRTPATPDDSADLSKKQNLVGDVPEVELPTENVVDIDLNLGTAAKHGDPEDGDEDDGDEDDSDEDDGDEDEADEDEADEIGDQPENETRDAPADKPA